MKNRLLKSLSLFITFFKIGLFTFGGGYAMISLMQEELVEKKKWLTQDDFFEMLIISESTPGPISVNIATYTGHKVASYVGSVFSTLGLITPSFIIIYIISLFLQQFLQLKIVEAAFSGLKIGVMVILINTVFKLSKGIKKNKYFYIVFTLSLVTMLLFSIFLPSFSWISLILICLGLVLGIVNAYINKEENK